MMVCHLLVILKNIYCCNLYCLARIAFCGKIYPS